MIVALYLLKLRRTEREVSSTYLWRRMVRDVEANAPWQKLRPNLLLLLQLLFLAALIFALTHMQYALTPATLIILGVAVAFGWIRMRYNTTVAIVTHFFYNFIPLALNVTVGAEALQWLRSLGFGV